MSRKAKSHGLGGRADRRGLGDLGRDPGLTAMSRKAKSHGLGGCSDRRGLAGLGLGPAATRAAIQLPGEITLAFSSHARDLQQWIDLARAAGHEVLLDLPMEPIGYPAMDPGPQSLLTTLSSVDRLALRTTSPSRVVSPKASSCFAVPKRLDSPAAMTIPTRSSWLIGVP